MPWAANSRKVKAENESDEVLPAYRLTGVRVDRLVLSRVLHHVVQAVRSGRRITVLYVNVHCMNIAVRDASYSAVLDRADIVYCDGTGVRLGALLARQPLPARMTGADWIDDLCRLAVSEHLTLFLLGGGEGSAAAASEILRQRYPGLVIAGAAPGYSLGSPVLEAVNAARPDILLVGMGTPRQEKWIDAHRRQLDVPVVWAVGALFDFVNGHIRRGPRWMTDHGLEWVCRLITEPRKLWRRYLIGNPQFLWRVIGEYWLRRGIR